MTTQKSCNFVAKYKTMGANSSYKAMYDIVEQAKDGTIFIPDDFVCLVCCLFYSFFPFSNHCITAL